MSVWFGTKKVQMLEVLKNPLSLLIGSVMLNNKSVQKQVSIFNGILMNIFSSFTPNKLVTFDNRDPLG